MSDISSSIEVLVPSILLDLLASVLICILIYTSTLGIKSAYEFNSPSSKFAFSKRKFISELSHFQISLILFGIKAK